MMSNIDALPTKQTSSNAVTASDISTNKRGLDIVPHNTPDNPLYVAGSSGGGITSYQIDLTDLDSDPLYVGKTNSSGTWLVEKFSESAGTKLYANASNNAGYADLNSAWTDRLTLTYNQYHILTGV